ncbi:unnamed protein product [marine sediment metagenome]|uniref:Uncharacterized protein n=1 Tax=marine sediment metagenome TaxID=412755 RepID=X1A922_9ZZZZ
MALCDILDLRCIIVNELIGSVTLAILVFTILYFIFAGKIRLGFDSTIFLMLPILLIMGLVISGFSIIYAFGAVIAGILLAITFNRLIGNR